MRKYTAVTVALLVVLSLPLTTLAHGIGGSQSEIIGNHTVSFSYSELQPKDNEPILLTFMLKNVTTEENVPYSSVWTRILREGNLLFSSNIKGDVNGQASLTYLFMRDGLHTIAVKFMNNTETILSTEFSLDVKATSGTPGGSTVVIITDEGFEPSVLNVEPGETVMWVNKGNESHWPASNLHPTHTLYPGSGIEKCETNQKGKIFDACKHLEPGQNYSFTLEEPGVWGVHDHLNPKLTMQVRVITSELQKVQEIFPEEKGQLISQEVHKPFFTRLTETVVKKLTFWYRPDAEESTAPLYATPPSKAAAAVKDACNEKNKPKSIDSIACYSRQFETIAFEHGPEYSFELLTQLQRIDETAKNCHLLAHGIGWGTYKRSPKQWQQIIATINPTCVYGSIHGIVERYISDLPEGKLTKDEVTKICEARPNPACLHAVGHVVNLEMKDNLTKASTLCSAFPLDKRQRHYCLTGVFMEHMIADNLVQHGYYPLERRQKWYTHIEEFDNLCHSLAGENAIACWTEIVHASVIMFKGDAKKVFEHCESSGIIEAAKRCKRHAIGELVAKNKGDIRGIKSICELERERDLGFEGDCYIGLATNKLLTTAPENAKEVVTFCASLHPKFKTVCFEQIGKKLNERSISHKQIQASCAQAPKEMQRLCEGTTPKT